jgi:hypothetical protein
MAPSHHMDFGEGDPFPKVDTSKYTDAPFRLEFPDDYPLLYWLNHWAREHGFRDQLDGERVSRKHETVVNRGPSEIITSFSEWSSMIVAFGTPRRP